MYMFYLSSMIALSVGVGAFVQFDTESRQYDASARTRVEVAAQQQSQISRALRRELQIDPSAFPTPASGTYARLDSGLIESATAQSGTMLLDTSEYYINDSGEIIGFLTEGPSAPSSGNGDRDLGIQSRPQFLEDLLAFFFGDDFERGPLVSDVLNGQLSEYGMAFSDTLTEEDLQAFSPGAYTTIAQIDLPAPVATASQQLSSDLSSVLPQSARYDAISRRLGLDTD